MNDTLNSEEQRERIENALLNAIDDIDRDHLRKLQLTMHGCAKRCCADADASAEAVQRCVDRCQLPLTRARCYVQQELAEFESQLEGCMRDCQLPPNEDNKQAGCHLERCTLDCVDRHVALLPELLRSMRATLEKGL
ncbi:CG12661 [Drosophila busckii]|uniref:CG12661 n=1 Tax=Drosophila busckii TaxID=30019 RepID=A0A0M4ET71_DROBS|nr:protein FAM136A [Drosophila busckii]ALC49652.1 CG12661 [Drosophila busckii]